MGRYVSNEERGAANLVALVLEYRNKHAQIDSALAALALSLDEKLAQLKRELLGGASTAFDTLGEIQAIVEQNKSGVEVLAALAAGHVRFDGTQALTASEKQTARDNIGAVSQDELNSKFNSVVPATPTVTVSKSGNTATVKATDRYGITEVYVYDGEMGGHYTPSVDDDGNISWGNNKGLPNPVTKNIRGPKGNDGLTPVRGKDYWTDTDVAEMRAYIDQRVGEVENGAY